MKLHPKYRPFITHTGRYTIMTGGRGSGKSVAVAHYLVKLTFEAGHKIVVMRFTSKSAKNSTLAEIKKQIVILGLEDQFTVLADTVINRFSGSEIFFDGLKGNTGDNTARNKGREGVTTYVFEEAEDFRNEEEVDKIDEGLRIDNGLPLRMIFVMNPATKEHWIYKRFFLENGIEAGFNGIANLKDVYYDDGTPERVCYVHTTYLDNKHLHPSTRKIYERHKIHKPNYYKHAILGGWLDKSEGVIYPDWEYGEFPDDVETYFGADWGFSEDPDTLVEVHIDKKDKKIYLKEHLYQNDIKITELIPICKKAVGNKLIVADYGSGGDRIIAELKSNNINIKKCSKGSGSILEGIKLIQDYKLIVDKESVNLAIELNNYVWKDKGSAPKDSYNHLLDAMRYVITDRITPQKNGTYNFY